jgi:hypothetical protein
MKIAFETDQDSIIKIAHFLSQHIFYNDKIKSRNFVSDITDFYLFWSHYGKMFVGNFNVILNAIYLFSD